MSGNRAILLAVLLAMLPGCRSAFGTSRSQSAAEAAATPAEKTVHPALSPNPFVRARYEASWRSEHFALAMSDFFLVVLGGTLGVDDDEDEEECDPDTTYDPYDRDELWKEARGDHNPNKERLKQGEEPRVWSDPD